MSFIYPAFLFALLAIAIPIIIHLFNFRKFKTIYFSNVRFLKEVHQETQAKSKLKHLLVLAARILALSFLVFAFAQPYIPAENKKIIAGDKTVSIFIDNSFSMDAINKNGTLLDDAKKKALEIISTYKPTDRFQLLTNDFEGRHQRMVNKEEFVELLDEIKITPNTKDISEITSRQMDVLNQSGNKNKTSYILSDFQKSSVNIHQIKNDSTVQINFIPIVATEKNNVYIDTCWFETPVRQLNQIEKLHIRVKNNSKNLIENNSIKLFINNEQKTLASFNIDKGGETDILLSFSIHEPGNQHCKIEINDYPVTFDDTFYFSFEVTKNISVLSVHTADAKTENLYLNKLLGADSLFIFNTVSENKLDYSALSTNNLIILNELKSIPTGLAQELKRFMNNGGSVLIFPPADIDISAYKAFLQSVNVNFYERLDTLNTKVDNINLESTIYKDVFDKKLNTNTIDLPKINQYYIVSKNTRSNEEPLLKLQNGNVLLSKTDVEKGKLYTCAVGLQPLFGNFPKHALFVPTLYKIGMYSQEAQTLFYTIGNNQPIETNNIVTGENIFYIKGVTNEFEIIPEYKSYNSKTDIFVHNQIQNAGNYNLYAGKELIKALAFNYNGKESNLSCFSNDELIAAIENSNLKNIKIIESTNKQLNESLIEQEQGKKLWKVCIILALIFLAAEVALLRLMKG